MDSGDKSVNASQKPQAATPAHVPSAPPAGVTDHITPAASVPPPLDDGRINFLKGISGRRAIAGVLVLLVGLVSGVALIGQRQIFQKQAAEPGTGKIKITKHLCKSTSHGYGCDEPDSRLSGFDVELILFEGEESPASPRVQNLTLRLNSDIAQGESTDLPYGTYTLCEDRVYKEDVNVVVELIDADAGRKADHFWAGCRVIDLDMPEYPINLYNNIDVEFEHLLPEILAGLQESPSPTPSSEADEVLPPEVTPVAALPPTSPLPSTNPTDEKVTANCSEVQIYKDGVVLLAKDLPFLSAGDHVQLVISGYATGGEFDKAEFRVNGESSGDVTTKLLGTDAFYADYVIPSGVESFYIQGQVHHNSLGWL